MINLQRTDSTHPDFQKLVVELDRYLAKMDGEEHAFYAQYNKSDGLKYVVLAYDGDEAVGCGAIKFYDDKTMEVKRMYVAPSARGLGFASAILQELERWAKQLSYHQCLLETGVKQTEAIKLYEKNAYAKIENYGQYQGQANSVCFAKTLAITGQESTGSISKHEVNIRFANGHDAQTLAQLGKETFHEAFIAYPQMPKADLASYVEQEFTRAKLETQLAEENAFFLLAEYAGQAIAYAKMEVNQSPPGVDLQNPIKLRRLYCKQQYVGMGVGANLMERCILEANQRQHDGIYLTVWEHNLHAQGFYKKWSFEPCGTLDIVLGKAALRDLIMRKSLGQCQ